MSSQHLIGGTTAADRNIISGNTIGVNIGSPSARGNVVIGNYIGTDVTGTLDVGNTDAGVLVIGEANVIGGPAAGNGNVISGNDQVGVRLTGGATANSVEGNLIGVNAPGTGVLGNGIGVQVGVNVDGTASTNVIGGLVAGAGNEIAFNATIGVLVGQSSSDNAILGNAIHQNGTLGIDLIGNGITPNDPGDSDEGANNLTNFPVLSAVAGGVQGTLNSIPNTTFRIEFFGNTACDASGNGEGQIFLGSTSVTTDATGNAVIPLFAAVVDQFVTATATDSSNNTSEFSACVTAARGHRGSRRFRGRLAGSHRRRRPAVIHGHGYQQRSKPGDERPAERRCGMVRSTSTRLVRRRPASSRRSSRARSAPSPAARTRPWGSSEHRQPSAHSSARSRSRRMRTTRSPATMTSPSTRASSEGRSASSSSTRTTPAPARCGRPSSTPMRAPGLMPSASPSLAQESHTITPASRLASDHRSGDDRRHDPARLRRTPLIELSGNGLAGNGLNRRCRAHNDPRSRHQPFGGTGVDRRSASTYVQGRWMGTTPPAPTVRSTAGEIRSPARA